MAYHDDPVADGTAHDFVDELLAEWMRLFAPQMTATCNVCGPLLAAQCVSHIAANSGHHVTITDPPSPEDVKT